MAEGNFLHTYQLDYENKHCMHKSYEMVSRNVIHEKADIGKTASGVAMVVTVGEKLLLLKEFRMAVNSFVYNLCEGMLEEGESPTDCACRELKEETGLDVVDVEDVLLPCYPAPAFSDVGHSLIFVKAEGECKVSEEEEEIIFPVLCDKEEVEALLKTEKFSATAQMAAYYYVKNQK